MVLFLSKKSYVEGKTNVINLESFSDFLGSKNEI